RLLMLRNRKLGIKTEKIEEFHSHQVSQRRNLCYLPGDFTTVSGPVLEILGIRVTAFFGEQTDDQISGWNESERQMLQAKIAERQPFLDFAFSRVNSDGSTQQFRVSGEPMFDNACRFIGFRGIGVETTLR
ncbi:MAG: hypothetical protein V4772_28350, partial [Pseudomonadota bacterium]